MSYRVLWPQMRWPDMRDIEISSVGDEGQAEFCERFAEVTDEQWAAADALISVMDVPAEFHPKLAKCRILVTPKVGFDNLDLKAWGELGIPVCNVPDYGTMEVADHALALMLSLMKGITFHTRELKQDPRGRWRPALNPYGKRLSSCTLGLVGLGRIGTAVALRAKAFGMDVRFYDPYVENGQDLALGVHREQSLEALFAISDVVSLHLPLNEETERLINAQVLAHSKPGLILINTARGPIIDLDSLEMALRDETVLAVGLDVLPEEPADPAHPLISAWAHDEEWIDHRLLITPHSAFYTPESVYDMRYKAGEIAMRYLTAGRLENCVNQQYLANRR